RAARPLRGDILMTTADHRNRAPRHLPIRAAAAKPPPPDLPAPSRKYTPACTARVSATAAETSTSSARPAHWSIAYRRTGQDVLKEERPLGAATSPASSCSL